MKSLGQNWVLCLLWATPLFSHSGFGHPDPLWIPFKEVAVTLIYQLAEGPEGICAQILQGCAKQALEKLEEKSNPQDDPSKWPWVSGPCGQQPASAFPAGKKPLPPPLPTTPDPLSPHCHFCHSRWASHHHISSFFTSLCST